MKGSLHTDEVLSAVLNKATGIRTARRISHIFVMDVPTYPKLLLISDAAVNIAPDLDAKADICQNAIDLARTVGVERPKVAILSAVETIRPKIQSTLDAAALCKMADRGQIQGGLLDGLLAMDNAINLEAARIKKIDSEVAGVADVLIAPDLEAGNMALASAHIIVAIDYRLAPECPYPAQLKDTLASAKRVFPLLDRLGLIYKPRLSLIGDSGGGALCATVAHLSQFEPGLKLAAQVLIYPSLDYIQPVTTIGDREW